MSDNFPNPVTVENVVRTIPLTTLEGIVSTQAVALNSKAPEIDKNPSHNTKTLPKSQQASQVATQFNKNTGDNFSPVTAESLQQRRFNATLAVNPFAGAAATRGNIVASSKCINWFNASSPAFICIS